MSGEATSTGAAIDPERPVIMIGPLRSGTTLLRLMLDHHPEFEFFGEFEEGFHLVENRDEGWPTGEAYRDWLATSRQFRASGFEIDDTLGYRDQVRRFVHQAADRAKPTARLIGCTVHSGFHRAPEMWPEARYIHLLRDPRDVARSCIGMGWVGTVYHGVGYWLRVERRWDKLRAKLRDDQFIELKYEDLIANPERELGRICEFLGTSYNAAMLGYADGTTYKRPDPSLVEQWKRKQTPRQVQLVEHRCGAMLTNRGYEPSGHPPHDPGVLERALLAWRNTSGRVRFSMNRYGFSLWARWQLSRRLPLPGWRRRVQLEVNEVQRRHLR